MTDKFKRLDRRFTLSDSSVNVYGYRLLTSGYLADEFRKNPVGYYMHRREEGITVKWEDITIDGDNITGVPIINLANARGQQTCDEVENGFLNAASVGHIVVLEYSTDPALMLPGQTGPTITKWYNKECSLVDIPGNTNALTALYDAQENVLNLADIPGLKIALPEAGFIQQAAEALQLTDTNPQQLLQHLREMAGNTQALSTHCTELKAENAGLLERITNMEKTREQEEVNRLLQKALDDKKITNALRTRLAADYAGNAQGLSALLAEMPAYLSLTATLKAQTQTTENAWSWDDYDRHDPSGQKLQCLRSTNPDRYKQLFEAKFG